MDVEMNYAEIVGNEFFAPATTMNCAILEAKGYGVTEADFLKWNGCGVQYDRIVMNPPFSEGRAKAHVEHTATFLNPESGILVAVLPSSFRGKDILPNMEIEWSSVLDNEFSGTSISVVIMKARRAK